LWTIIILSLIPFPSRLDVNLTVFGLPRYYKTTFPYLARVIAVVDTNNVNKLKQRVPFPVSGLSQPDTLLFSLSYRHSTNIIIYLWVNIGSVLFPPYHNHNHSKCFYLKMNSLYWNTLWLLAVLLFADFITLSSYVQALAVPSMYSLHPTTAPSKGPTKHLVSHTHYLNPNDKRSSGGGCKPFSIDFTSFAGQNSLPSSFQGCSRAGTYSLGSDGLELYLLPPPGGADTVKEKYGVNNVLGQGATVNSTWEFLCVFRP
jgi:hypothetical protein